MITKDKSLGCLLGLAIGDALGMSTESKSKELIKEEFGLVTDYQKGYLPAGSYTDDTQQAIILIESLLKNVGFNKENYSRDIVTKTDFSRGIGPSLLKFIRSHLSDKKQNNNINNNKIYPSNGLAMKIAPVALFYHNNPENINQTIEQIASLTHKHSASLAGGIAIAQSVNYVLNKDVNIFNNKNFLDYVVNQTKIYDAPLADMIKNKEIIEDNSCSVYSTVPQSIHTFIENPNFEKGIIKLINSGGDTDTKAAMFGAISGSYNGFRKIPKRWIEGLENKLFGRDYIISLANRL